MTPHLTSIRIGVLLAMAMALSGCPEPPQLNPPQLYIEPLPPRVTNIKLENGAGEVLYNGKHPGSGKQITENPTPEQLDGTMTITRTYDDGQVKKQTLTYEAGKPVHIGYRDSTDSYYVEEPPKIASNFGGLFGSLNPSFEFVNRPNTDIVRREDGGVVTGYVKGDNDSRNPAFNGTIGYKFSEPFLGAKAGLELTGSYYTSKSTTMFEQILAGGGANRLAIFGPVAGGGFSTISNLSNVNYSSDYTTWSIQPRFTKSYGVGTVFGTPVRMNSYVGFNYGKNEDDETLSGTVDGVGDFMTMNWVDNWYYGPEGGFYSAWDLCHDTKLTLGGFVNFNVNELSADRSISSTFGQNGRDELSDTKYTVGGGANIGFHLKVTQQISAKAEFEYRRDETAPAVKINQSNGQASVDAQAADVYAITIGAKINF